MTKFQTDNAGSVIWNSNRGAVSVGIKGKETRQITNVAAGTEDTDAVNIAQLKAIDSKVDANKISFFLYILQQKAIKIMMVLPV